MSATTSTGTASQPAAMPTAARVLVALVSVAGLAAVAWRGARLGVPGLPGLAAVAAVAVAVVVTDRFTFKLPHGDDTEHVMLSDAVWTAALVLVPVGVPTLGAVVGTAVWQLASRWPLRKVAFNVGQVALAMTVAEEVFRLGGPDQDPLSARTWAFVAAAMVPASIVNVGLVALVISLVQKESVRTVLLGPWRLTNIQWVGNVSVGLLAAVLWTVSPWGVVLLAAPLVLLSLAYRDWVHSTIEANQMEQMMKGAEAIARRRTFDARLPVGEGGGRLPELAVALNHMLDQLELALHRQRRIMADVAGRLRRPVSDVSCTVADRAVRSAHEAAPDSDAAVSYRQMRDDLDAVHRILDDMAEIGSSQLPGWVSPRDVDVDDLVADIAAKAEPLLGDRLTVAPAPRVSAPLDRSRMETALLRLLKNTADHGAGARPVTFRTLDEDGAVRFEVVDEGGGVPAGHEEAIFEPFYKVDGRRDGVGLGLALVRSVAEAHGGSAGVVNRPGAGVTFWMRVPR